MALAGGTTIYPEQNHGYFYKPGEILSPDGHCRTFDAKAAGTVMASAVGCVVLRRLEDAIRDGDRVLAIIRGSAVNNDGSNKVGYLAPSVSGQTRVVSEALAVAGVPVEQLNARGHFHSSFTMVDVVITGVSGRVQMAEALRRFAGLPSDRRQGDEVVRTGRTASPREIDAAAG
jgi:3-oxoacyl-(acyl-carrier-protein) synthase